MKRKRGDSNRDQEHPYFNTSDNEILSTSVQQLLYLLKCPERNQCFDVKSDITIPRIVRRLFRERDVAVNFFTSRTILNNLTRWNPGDLGNFLSMTMEELDVFDDEYAEEQSDMSCRNDIEEGVASMKRVSGTRDFRGNDVSVPTIDIFFDSKKENHTYLLLQFVTNLTMARYSVHLPNNESFSSDHLNVLAQCWPDSRSFEKGLKDNDNHVDIYRDEGIGEDWIICIAFMLSYTILYKRLKSKMKHFSLEENATETKSDGHESHSISKACTKLGIDRICIACINNLYLLQKATTCKKMEFDSSDEITGYKILTKCFPSQLDNVNKLMKNIHHASSSPIIQQTPKVQNTVVIKKSVNTNFEKLWLEMKSTSKNIGTHDEESIVDIESHGFVSQNDEDLLSQRYVARETANEADIQSTVIQDNVTKVNCDENLDLEALQIRKDLLNLPRNPPSSTTNQMAHSIAQLIGKANGRFKVDDIFSIGKALIEGDDTDEKKKRIVISDDIISKLCSLCITDETSAVRVCALMTAFLLPIIEKLRTDRSRPASRLFVSTMLNLSKTRPMESMRCLWIPALSRNGNNIDSIAKQPSKVQCELIGRLIKSVPNDILSKFVVSLLNDENLMCWNEHAATTLSACLQKKPSLPDDIIFSLSKQVLRCSKIEALCKSIKFASMVHTFVFRYGSQIRNNINPSCIDILHDAASHLKVLLGKSIMASLEKL